MVVDEELGFTVTTEVTTEVTVEIDGLLIVDVGVSVGEAEDPAGIAVTYTVVYTVSEEELGLIDTYDVTTEVTVETSEPELGDALAEFAVEPEIGTTLVIVVVDEELGLMDTVEVMTIVVTDGPGVAVVSELTADESDVRGKRVEMDTVVNVVRDEDDGLIETVDVTTTVMTVMELDTSLVAVTEELVVEVAVELLHRQRPPSPTNGSCNIPRVSEKRATEPASGG